MAVPRPPTPPGNAAARAFHEPVALAFRRERHADDGVLGDDPMVEPVAVDRAHEPDHHVARAPLAGRADPAVQLHEHRYCDF